ncbi:alcohol dehydrogenase catalytic domain-containing protein [Agromyces mediolanus]|uniref:Glutathione-dependent formaldehyde dehydrogenase n=1 Tax=Agromyces mediolanus TaxID=41986 RepID=A0A918FE90_AGRME|nr:alcohol dehydrogenase catalytic domain-containing protein [Agromyces mediolanus]GGR28287.1 glutathione-dependent formaldehyde dehydrogenase [Agromyces mediolanus]GLJ72054.1 glutathione-dependent formaldehyde dehydrogenase [Agromyces mediolanus]
MRALTWQAPQHVSVESIPDPAIEEPGDVIIRVTSTAICGSDLHLYGVLGPFLHRGDVLGHEAMGVVVEVGRDVRRVALGDRVVVPFAIACGECAMCRLGLTTQCETTQNRDYGTGAQLYGYTELYGSVPGGQAEYLRVRRADANAVVVGHELPDDRYLFLSDVLPTAWQGVEYAAVPPGGTVAVLGLGPVGQLCVRIARHRGLRVLAIDPVPERRLLAERYGAETFDLDDDALAALLDATEGHGPDSVIDAVGMEAKGNPVVSGMQRAIGMLPDAAARKLMLSAGLDRQAALLLGIEAVRRGGTLSLVGVYAGTADPMPMMRLFDKQVQLRMGQCNVHAWQDALRPLVEDPDDPLGTEDLATHRVPLDRARRCTSCSRRRSRAA